MTHACVLAVALSLFSPSPGLFMGFRLPYLYFFSCINTLAPLESSSVVTQPLMVCWLSEFRINSECSVLLFRALRYFSEISVSVCLPLASLCMNYLSFWVGFGSVGVQLGNNQLATSCLFSDRGCSVQLYQCGIASA